MKIDNKVECNDDENEDECDDNDDMVVVVKSESYNSNFSHTVLLLSSYDK